jgi:hypothetical protein
MLHVIGNDGMLNTDTNFYVPPIEFHNNLREECWAPCYDSELARFPQLPLQKVRTSINTEPSRTSQRTSKTTITKTFLGSLGPKNVVYNALSLATSPHNVPSQCTRHEPLTTTVTFFSKSHCIIATDTHASCERVHMALLNSRDWEGCMRRLRQCYVSCWLSCTAK